MTQDLRELATQRSRLHTHHRSQRPLSSEYDLVGLAGEKAFAERYGYNVDRELRPGGDGRIDFETPVGTVDVKTARKAYNLLREQGKPHADLLVLAEYDDATEQAVLLGWEWDREMLKCPAKDFGYGIVNHYLHRSRLRSIDLLDDLMRQ